MLSGQVQAKRHFAVLGALCPAWSKQNTCRAVNRQNLWAAAESKLQLLHTSKASPTQQSSTLWAARAKHAAAMPDPPGEVGLLPELALAFAEAEALQEPPEATAVAAASAVAVASAPDAAALATAFATQVAWEVLDAEAAARAACSTSGLVSLKTCCMRKGLGDHRSRAQHTRQH